jgi:23S rRNA A1618 N6-methylase RlmF
MAQDNIKFVALDQGGSKSAASSASKNEFGTSADARAVAGVDSDAGAEEESGSLGCFKFDFCMCNPPFFDSREEQQAMSHPGMSSVIG